MATSPLDNLTITHLLETIPSGLFVVDLEMRIHYWNQAAERITGFSAEEAVGRHCSFLQGIPCGERCGLLDPGLQKPIVGAPCVIHAKDGRRISLLKNVDYLRDADGQIIGGIESFQDVSLQQQFARDLRHQSEELEKRVVERTEELTRSESRLRAVLDTMDDLAYCAAADYRITLMNRAMRQLYGERVGEICHRVLHDAEQPCSWCAMPRVLAGETLREERPMEANHHLYEIIHSPLAGPDGALQKLAVCRDITERKQVEQQLRETNRELDAFAHSISHDLRSLLAPVVTYMDYLRMEYGQVLDPQILQVLTEVERQSERAIMLLDDLLDLAQVGRIMTDGQPVEIDKLVNEVIRDNSVEGDQARPDIVVGPLPPMAIPESLAFQVFSNLIGNALRYAGPDGGPIEIGCREEADRHIYFVRDHGPGVDPLERKRIFNIFHRGSAARQTRGTGVGLAIVQKVAHRHQGTAWVEETPGGGATFCFALPRQAD